MKSQSIHTASAGLVALLSTAVHAQTGPAAGTELRILPLGDSITWGYCSPDLNGYRLQLQQNLQGAGYDVVFAGTVNSGGSMTDGWCEGYPGHTIEYITEAMPAGVEQLPNIVLLHAGTNDMNPDPTISQQGSDPTAASLRLGSMIDNVTAIVPNAAILVAQIIGLVNNEQQTENTNTYNSLIPGIVQERAAQGTNITVVNFEGIQGALINQSCGGVHPTEQGYLDMGDIWTSAIMNLTTTWVQPPSGPDPVRD